MSRIGKPIPVICHFRCLADILSANKPNGKLFSVTKENFFNTSYKEAKTLLLNYFELFFKPIFPPDKLKSVTVFA